MAEPKNFTKRDNENPSGVPSLESPPTPTTFREIDRIAIETAIPDPMDRQVKTRAERIKFNDTGKWAAVSPTADDPYSIFLSNQIVVDHLMFQGQSNPILAQISTQSDSAAALNVEIGAAVPNHEVASQIVEALYNETNLDFAAGEFTPPSDDAARAWEILETQLTPEALFALKASMAGLSIGGQENLLALSLDYTDRTNMDDPGSMENFIVWQYTTAQERQQWEYSEVSPIGQVTAFVNKPVRYTAKLARTAWANAASPQDAWYRDDISLGGNFAISTGADPGSVDFRMRSGIVDGIWNVVGDPVAWAGNAAAGYKLAKTAPLIAEGSRFKMALQAFIPFKGANNLQLPWGTRSRVSQFAYLFSAKRVDDLLAANRLTTEALAATSNAGAILEAYPQLRRATGLVSAIARESDPDQVEWLIRAGLTGAFDKNSPIWKARKDAYEAAEKALREGLDANLIDDTVDPDGVYGLLEEGVGGGYTNRKELQNPDAFPTWNEWVVNNIGEEYAPTGVYSSEASKLFELDASQLEQARMFYDGSPLNPELAAEQFGDLRIYMNDGTDLEMSRGEVEQILELQRKITAKVLEDMPDEIIVFRIGDPPGQIVGPGAETRNARDFAAFTLDPGFLHRYQLESLGRNDARMRAYRVKKADLVLARVGKADPESEVWVKASKLGDEIGGYVDPAQPSTLGSTSSFDSRMSNVLQRKGAQVGEDVPLQRMPGYKRRQYEDEIGYPLFVLIDPDGNEVGIAQRGTTTLAPTERLPSGEAVPDDQGIFVHFDGDHAFSEVSAEFIDSLEPSMVDGMLASRRVSPAGAHAINNSRIAHVASPKGVSLNTARKLGAIPRRAKVWRAGFTSVTPPAGTADFGSVKLQLELLDNMLGEFRSLFDPNGTEPLATPVKFIQHLVDRGTITSNDASKLRGLLPSGADDASKYDQIVNTVADWRATGIADTGRGRYNEFIQHIPDEIGKNDGRLKVVARPEAKILDLSDDDEYAKLLEWTRRSGREEGKKETLIAYMRANGFDGATNDEGQLAIANQKKFWTGYDYEEQGSYVPPELLELAANRVKSKAEWNEFRRNRNTDLWVIKEMPTGKLKVVDDTATVKPRMFGGGSNNKSWWRRAIKSRVFGEYPSDHIDLADDATGAEQLKRTLRYWGVPEQNVQQYVDRFLNTSFMDKYSETRAIIQDAAETIDHPIIRYRLVEFVNSQGVRGFGFNEAGEEVLTTASRSAPNGQSPKPFLPSHLTDKLYLPDPKVVSESMRRYKWGKFNGPNWITEGILSSTKERRAGIAAKIKEHIGAKFGDKALDGLTEDQIVAMAYAAVGPGTIGDNAHGAVAKMTNTVSKAWRGLVSGFSVAMLAFRPFAWSGRVLLDENARGAFAELPSILRNPVRSVQHIMDAHYAGKFEEYRAIQLANANEVMKQFRGIDDVQRLWDNAKEIIPNLAELIDVEDLGSAQQLRTRIARIINRAYITNDFGSIVVDVPRRIQRKYGRSMAVLSELGIDPTRRGASFTWEDDVHEMLNSGWATLYGQQWKTRKLEHVPGQMDFDSLDELSVHYHNNLRFLSNDPVVRVGMRVLSKRLNGDDISGAEYVQAVSSRGWQRLKAEIITWGKEQGYNTADEMTLFSAYMDEIVVPYVEQMFKPILSDSIYERAAQYDQIANSRRLVDEGLDFRWNNNGADAFSTKVYELDSKGQKVPDLYGLFSPYTFGNDTADDYARLPARLASKVIQVFGDNASQKLQRRPAYLARFRAEKQYRMALGMNEAQANEIAHIAAFEQVNNVYYNLNSVTPFLKSMNQVIPFFTAAWEIAQTWGYKIPMMQGGMPLGYPNVIRKVDRVFDALTSLGLIKYDEDGQPTLYLDTQADTGPGRAIQDALSKSLGQLIRTPLVVGEHFLNLGHALAGMEMDREDSIVPDSFSFAVSSPIDTQHYGIGSALDIALSPQPVAQYAISELRKKIPLVAEHKTQTYENMTLAGVAQQENVDPWRLLGYNEPKLREKFGGEVADMIMTGAIPLSEVDVSGIELLMPNTSIWSRIVSDVFFPFGDLDDPQSIMSQFAPSWIDYAFRGFGLWNKGEEEDGFQSVNIDMSNSTVSSAVISALRHMSVEDDVFAKMSERRERFYALAQPYLDQETAYLDETGELRWRGERPPEAQEVEAAYLSLKHYSDSVMVRAVENAASALWMRGALAFVLPGTPRMFYEEEKALDAYYQGRATAEGKKPALESYDIDSTVQAIQDWVADPAGSFATRTFIENHPELQPYLVGKTYWEPGGQPPLERSLDLYFQDTEAGLRTPVPPDVWMHMNAIRDAENDRSVAFKTTYGDDPYRAAAASIADPQGYKDLMEPYNTWRDRLEWEDELNGSPYDTWRNRNKSEEFNIIAEAISSYQTFENVLSDVIQIAEADPNMTLDELKELNASIGKMKAGINDIEQQFRETDADVGWMRPEARLRLQYFTEVYGPYLDELSTQYDALETAQTGEERSIIFNKIAQIKDRWADMDIRFDERPDVQFPSPSAFQLENKHPALRELSVTRSITYPAEFFDKATVDEAVTFYPPLAEYLPTTPAQREVWDWYSGGREYISQRYMNNTGDVDESQVRRAREQLDKEFQQRLADNGWYGMIEWQDLWDVQKLERAGALPESFKRYKLVEQVNAIQRARAAQGYKSVGSKDPGRRALTRTIWKLVEEDPVFAQDLAELGDRVYGEAVPDSFIDELFFNDSF